MVRFYLKSVLKDSEGNVVDIQHACITKDIFLKLHSFIHEEVSHDFISTSTEIYSDYVDVDITIDLSLYHKALLRTFVKDYNMEYLKEHGVDF